MVIQELQILKSAKTIHNANVVRDHFQEKTPLKLTATSVRDCMRGNNVALEIDGTTVYFLGTVMYNTVGKVIGIIPAINTSILKTRTLSEYSRNGYSKVDFIVNKTQVPEKLIVYINKYTNTNVNILSSDMWNTLYNNSFTATALNATTKERIIRDYLESQLAVVDARKIIRQLNGEPIEEEVEETPQVTEAPTMGDIMEVAIPIATDTNNTGGLDWLITGQDRPTTFNPDLTAEIVERAIADITNAPRDMGTIIANTAADLGINQYINPIDNNGFVPLNQVWPNLGEYIVGIDPVNEVENIATQVEIEGERNVGEDEVAPMLF